MDFEESMQDAIMLKLKKSRISGHWISSKMDVNNFKARKLYIWLGLDIIFTLNFDHLSLDMVDMKSILPNLGTEYTSGSFFVMDSKLHYLGGGGGLVNFNNKVSSFNLPSFMPDPSTYFPDHSGGKPRPIVFTISNKVYALATLPVSKCSQSQPNLFEVYEPEIGKWRSLPSPPIPALYTLTSHCVFRNKLLLQTFYGDLIFDANAEMKEWEITNVYPQCCAVLEYEDLVLVLTKEPFKLVAYGLTSFGDIKGSPLVVEIEKNYFDFSKLNIVWASLNLVGNNCICLVFISNEKFHVSLFKVMKTDDRICAHVEAYNEFCIPIECAPDFLRYSTFLWKLGQQQGVEDEEEAARRVHSFHDEDQGPRRFECCLNIIMLLIYLVLVFGLDHILIAPTVVLQLS